jgi:isopenicillin-N N-acyltransferase like protein
MTGHTFPLIEVRGSAYEMGRQHGEQAAALIRRYLLLIERLTGKPSDELCRNARQFLPRMEALSPALVQEVRGLAEGAAISFDEALLCQVRMEAAHTWPESGAAMPSEGCTAFALRGAATADGSLLVGQNQDLEPEFADISILLRVAPDDGRPRALLYTFAGQLGYFGMNAHGVCNYANSVYDFRWQPGLAHYPLKRRILEQRTVSEATDLFRRHAVCSAANTMLGDGEGDMAGVEVRPIEGVAVWRGEHPDAIVHTNHYLTEAFIPFETGTLPDSFARYRRMTELVREHWGRITVEHMQAFLADHQGESEGGSGATHGAICRHGLRGMHTTSGHIAEPQKGVVHIRRGHGCLGTWTTYTI